MFCELVYEEPRCEPCPMVCSADIYTCPDGTDLTRDENKNCEFPECPLPSPSTCCDPYSRPSQRLCFEGIECCPNTGEWSCSIGDGKTYVCGDLTITGIYGEPCGCPNDLKLCPDGSEVKRDPYNSCEHAPCPQPPPATCCDPADEPGLSGNNFCREGTACCPDGSWAYSIGDGKTYPCGGELITSGFGKRCENLNPTCCNPLEEPGQFGNPLCFEGSACCPDGTWACGSIGDGQTFVCGGKTISSGFGEVCELDCEVCPGGYFDGCNVCACDGNGPSRCTLRACGPELGPKTCKQMGTGLVGCTQDVRICEDGSSVARDPDNDCNFFPCPSKPTCCDISGGEPICIYGPFCCEDCCTWMCGNGIGSYDCGLTCCKKEVNCEKCACGYNDGCNDCQCGLDGSVVCTERACLLQGIPACLDCSPSPPIDNCPLRPCQLPCGICQNDEVCKTEPSSFTGPNGQQCPGCPVFVGCVPASSSTQCGTTICGDGLVCCNSSCGICTPPGGACTQQVCEPTLTQCGSTSCSDGFVCCNPSCGICTPPDGACTQQVCEPSPIKCGRTTCGEGLVCCNASCGICTPPGGACTQQACVDNIGCDTCECGYSDGCNDCRCASDGSVSCTERYCVWEGIPSCLDCTAP